MKKKTKWRCSGCKEIIEEKDGHLQTDNSEKMPIFTMLCENCIKVNQNAPFH